MCPSFSGFHVQPWLLATPRHATPGRLPQINALQLYKLHTTATCYLLVEICFIVQFGTGWQVAICKLYILCLCEWHHVYGVTPPLWAQTWCHGVTAGLFNHIKRTWNTCLRVSVSLLHRFFVGLYFAASHLSPLSPVRVSSLPSSLLSIPPSVLRGGRDLNFEQKTQGGKLCRKHLKCVPPSAVLRNVIHTQGTLSKEAESSWLKPDNAHGSLQLLQILVLLLWLFVLLLPLGPSRVFVYLCSVLRSCQKMRAGLPFWPQVNLQLTKVYF